jgi:hypothetical protein
MIGDTRIWIDKRAESIVFFFLSCPVEESTSLAFAIAGVL